MHEHRADALQLTPGQPVSLLVKGNPRPVTRDPLSDAQIVSLVREIAPGDLAALVTPGAQLSFAYHAPTGSIDVEMTPGARRRRRDAPAERGRRRCRGRAGRPHCRPRPP